MLTWLLHCQQLLIPGRCHLSPACSRDVEVVPNIRLIKHRKSVYPNELPPANFKLDEGAKMKSLASSLRAT